MVCSCSSAASVPLKPTIQAAAAPGMEYANGMQPNCNYTFSVVNPDRKPYTSKSQVDRELPSHPSAFRAPGTSTGRTSTSADNCPVVQPLPFQVLYMNILCMNMCVRVYIYIYMYVVVHVNEQKPDCQKTQQEPVVCPHRLQRFPVPPKLERPAITCKHRQLPMAC